MRWLAYILLRGLGWRFEGEIPDEPKFVAIGAPHTSNWDFVVFLGILWHFRLKARYLGKHTLFRWPLGVLMRRLGGIPVNRKLPRGVVEAAAGEFGLSEAMILVIAPESTRSSTSHWRSGFYRIALAAEVPILPAYVDREEKRAGVGELLDLTGDPADDMDRIRAFYGRVIPDRPAVTGAIRLREEGDPPRA
jgi:1-acyl-sn-glycerol-3-phosphate acyltransferase